MKWILYGLPVVIIIALGALLFIPRGGDVVKSLEVGQSFYPTAEDALNESAPTGKLTAEDLDGGVKLLQRDITSNDTVTVHEILLTGEHRAPTAGQERPHYFVTTVKPEEKNPKENADATTQKTRAESTIPWGLYIGVLFSIGGTIGMYLYFKTFLAPETVEGDLRKAALQGMPESIKSIRWKLLLKRPRTGDDEVLFDEVGAALAKEITVNLMTTLLRREFGETALEDLADTAAAVCERVTEHGLPGLQERTGLQADLLTIGGEEGIDLERRVELYLAQRMEDRRIVEHRQRLDGDRQRIFDEWMEKSNVTPEMAFRAAMAAGEIVPENRTEIHPGILDVLGGLGGGRNDD